MRHVEGAVALVPSTLPPLRPPWPQGLDPRELVGWCQARLAHYKVPAAVHVLERMPTTGSGKILKTELRRIFAGAAPLTGGSAEAGGAVALGPAQPAVHPAARLSGAQAAAVLARVYGGGLEAQPVDASLGVEWDRELYPQLTYVVVAATAAEARHLVRRLQWG